MNYKLSIISFFFIFHFSLFIFKSYAQDDPTPFFKGAIKKNRIEEQRNIINYLINKNLSLPLADSTEENWGNAFWAMELLQYKSDWAKGRINIAFESIEKRSTNFQRSLLELAYANYPKDFTAVVTKFIEHTNNEKVFALCAEYLKQNDPALGGTEKINDYIWEQFETANNLYAWYKNTDSLTGILIRRLSKQKILSAPYILTPFFAKDFLKKNVVVYSIQRKNRNYPGIAVVKDTTGNFIKNDDGSIFCVPQLARSVGNLPFYITNGNTPQGIFRMHGFDISKANYIGPTKNIQLTMPFETSIKKLINDSTITDSVWSEDWYKKLLPAGLKDYKPLYETYYAGGIGRTEIIAHGTTVNPEYYHDKIFYPLTPTQGCLCTKEIWSDEDGKRLVSDQQKLVKVIKKAGGADGYYIVIEINDLSNPVTIEDILPFIK